MKRLTPTEKWGPIAGGKNEIFNPGDVFEIDDVRAQKLVMAGKAELVNELALPGTVRRRPAMEAKEPEAEPKPKAKSKKKGGKENADSDQSGGDD